jgi:hypothetical protein
MPQPAALLAAWCLPQPQPQPAVVLALGIKTFSPKSTKIACKIGKRTALSPSKKMSRAGADGDVAGASKKPHVAENEKK